jgi:mRNA-degrading endonuclease YafQ of YafQ-DinJ toxin-antitoxin module
MEFLYTARFLRSLKKLLPEIQSDIFSSVEEFKNKKNHQRLELHKLHGEMKKYHSFSANFYYRVIIKMEKKKVYFMDVGTHEVYK